MPEVKIVAPTIHPDEPCHGLYEGPRGGRWISAVYVIRGDAIAEHVIDHGQDIDFDRIPPLMMPCFGEENVGTMLEWGDRHRHDLRWWKREQEWRGESTLIQDVINQEAERLKMIRNASFLAPGLMKHRNDYHRAETWRNWFEERSRRTGKSRIL